MAYYDEIGGAPNTTQIGDQPLNLRRAIQGRMNTGMSEAEQAKKVALMLKALKQQEAVNEDIPPKPPQMPIGEPLEDLRPAPYTGPDPLPTVETPPEGPRPSPGMYLEDGTFLPGLANSQGGVDVGTPGFLAQFQNNPAIMRLLEQLGYMENKLPEVGYTPPEIGYTVEPPMQQPEPRIQRPEEPTPPQPSYPFDENLPSDRLIKRLGYGP